MAVFDEIVNCEHQQEQIVGCVMVLARRDLSVLRKRAQIGRALAEAATVTLSRYDDVRATRHYECSSDIGTACSILGS